MNDSGFWVFAKMGGLTEGEALRSWTVLLLVLSDALTTSTQRHLAYEIGREDHDAPPPEGTPD